MHRVGWRTAKGPKRGSEMVNHFFIGLKCIFEKPLKNGCNNTYHMSTFVNVKNSYFRTFFRHTFQHFFKSSLAP